MQSLRYFSSQKFELWQLFVVRATSWLSHVTLGLSFPPLYISVVQFV